jgi:PAS domain-containing protein
MTELKSWTSIDSGRAERQLESAQHGLRKSRAYLVNTQHMAHFGNWGWDIAHDTLGYSDEAAHILGLPEDNQSVFYQDLQKLIHPADNSDFLHFIEQMQSEDKIFDLEHRSVRPDGIEHSVHHRPEVAVMKGVCN